jgi:peptide/nickel transport system substrate-binding protein
LLRVDPHSARLQPGLAESWEYAANGRQVVFHLLPDLAWSDGTPLTAAAIADSLRASRHPALDAFSKLEAPDNRSLKLTFAEIDCAAVTNLALLPLLPSSEITATIPTGSGPFIVTEWPADRRRLSLARNPYYHGPGPALENIIIRFLRADEVAIALSEGQFDLLGPLATEPESSARPDYEDITYPAA